MGERVHLSVELELEPIQFTCGHFVYLTTRFIKERRSDHKDMWCPHCGTVNSFPQQSQLERKQNELEAARMERDWHKRRAEKIELQRRAQKAATTKLRNRIRNGVCPCCTRSFTNLAEHMRTQHPDFEPDPPPRQP